MITDNWKPTDLDNTELNAVIYVLREWKNGKCGLGEEALEKFIELLIHALSKYRNIREDKSTVGSILPDSKSLNDALGRVSE